MHPTDRNVQVVTHVKWTESLNNIFACKGKEEQLRDINQVVNHGNTTVKGKTNKSKEMYEAASVHHWALFAWKSDIE